WSSLSNQRFELAIAMAEKRHARAMVEDADGTLGSNLVSGRSGNRLPSGRCPTRQAEFGADEEPARAVPKETPDHRVGQTGAAIVCRQFAAAEHAMNAETGDPDGAFAILQYVARPFDRQPLGCTDDAPSG